MGETACADLIWQKVVGLFFYFLLVQGCFVCQQSTNQILLLVLLKQQLFCWKAGRSAEPDEADDLSRRPWLDAEAPAAGTFQHVQRLVTCFTLIDSTLERPRVSQSDVRKVFLSTQMQVCRPRPLFQTSWTSDSPHVVVGECVLLSGKRTNGAKLFRRTFYLF